MMSVFLVGVSSIEDVEDLEDSEGVPFSVLLMGVEVTAGTGCVLTGESEVRGDAGS